SVPLMSVVFVVVMDWTETWWSDPTPTLPTAICRVFRRGARTGGGGAGMPRFTEVTGVVPFDQVGSEQWAPCYSAASGRPWVPGVKRSTPTGRRARAPTRPSYVPKSL